MTDDLIKILVATIREQNEQMNKNFQQMFDKLDRQGKEISAMHNKLGVVEATMVTTESCATNQKNCPRKGISPLNMALVVAVLGLIATRWF